MHSVTQPSSNPNVKDQRPGARFDCDFKTFRVVLYGHVNTVVVFVDAYSKKSYSYWLFYPTEASPNLFLHKVFKRFYAEVCIPNKWLHFLFHPDNAKTFLSGEMLAYCIENHIVVDPSVKYKSSTNGIAECTIRDLTKAGMCNLISGNLHKSLYNFAWNFAELVANCLPVAPSYLSPNFLTDGSETNMEHFHSFASKCFVLNHSVLKPSTNLAAPADEGLYLGQEFGHSTKFFVLLVKPNIVSKYGTGDVAFDERCTSAHTTDQDVNEQLAFLDEIDAACSKDPSKAAVTSEPPADLLSLCPPCEQLSVSNVSLSCQICVELCYASVSCIYKYSTLDIYVSCI
jgi:hypothetical protein